MKIRSLNRPQNIKDFKTFKRGSMKRYNDMENKLKSKYDINILEDIILSQSDKIILFANLTDRENVILEVVSGTFEIIGFEDVSELALNDLLSYFDFNNGYAKVAGEKDYYNGVCDVLHDFNDEPNVTFPIINNQGRHWIRFHLVPLQKNANFATVFITEVTNFLIEEEALFVKTHHDPLTGVFNQYTLDYHYDLRSHLENLHVLYFDLDNFKLLNDQHGHKAGNDFLVDFSNILKLYEANFNRFYRVGGDEFVGLFFESEVKIKQIANDILLKTTNLAKDKYDHDSSVSIGILYADQNGDNLITKADAILYEAKAKGKNQFIYKLASKL